MSGIEAIDGDRFAHGTRARYVAGECRCEPCTLANRAYARERARANRAGLANGLIDAAPVRAHLEGLAAAGVGLRAVADASDVGRSALMQIRAGQKLKVRKLTAERILKTDAGAIADHACVPAKDTRAAFREMQRLGLTKGEIAMRLGCETPALQYKGSRVLVATAFKVQRLLAEVREEVAATRVALELCPTCDDSHAPERRLEWLRRVAGAEPADIIDAKPCWYGGGESGSRKLFRDLAALRGQQHHGAST